MSILSSTNKVIIKKTLQFLFFMTVVVTLIGVSTYKETDTYINGISKERTMWNENDPSSLINWTSVYWDSYHIKSQSEIWGNFDGFMITTSNSYIQEEHIFFQRTKYILNLNQKDLDFIRSDNIPYTLNSTQVINMLDDGRKGKVISNMMFYNTVKYMDFHLIHNNEPFLKQPVHMITIQISDPMNIPDYLILK